MVKGSCLHHNTPRAVRCQTTGKTAAEPGICPTGGPGLAGWLGSMDAKYEPTHFHLTYGCGTLICKKNHVGRNREAKRPLANPPNHKWVPDRLDALTDTLLRAISVHGGFPRRIKGLGTVTDPLAQTPRDALRESPCSNLSAG